jgi:hypothetical protein
MVPAFRRLPRLTYWIPPSSLSAATQKRNKPEADSLFDDAFGYCPTNCTLPKRQCRMMHRCTGQVCAGRQPHWASPDHFKYYQGGAGNRQKGCAAGNRVAAQRLEEQVHAPERKRRREEAIEMGAAVDTHAQLKIKQGEVMFDSAVACFDGAIDMYVYCVSLGSNRATLYSESVSTNFQQTNSNSPILRTRDFDPDKGMWNNSLVSRAERVAAADDSHVFELCATFDKQAVGDMERAMQMHGEQITASSGGRIKKLWRRLAAGGPKSGGPYKVGLIIIERNSDYTLGPGKWVRTDEF